MRRARNSYLNALQGLCRDNRNIVCPTPSTQHLEQDVYFVPNFVKPIVNVFDARVSEQ